MLRISITPLFMSCAAAATIVSAAGCSGGGATSSIAGLQTGNSTLATRAGKPGLPDPLVQALYPLRSTQPSHRSSPRGHGWLSPKAAGGSGLLYVGDFDNNVVTIYERRGVNPPSIGQITDGLGSPERLFVDAAGSLYVSNGTGNTVTVYPKGMTSPSLTISDGISGPTGLTVDSAGTVYVANTGTDVITEYPAGSTSPSLTTTVQGTPENLATDSAGNLYASGFYGSTSGVLEYAPGATTGVNLGIVVGDAGGIEVDRSGGIALADMFASVINLYQAGQTQPYRQISLGSGLPFELAMNKKQGQLYASVLVGSGFAIQRIGYPNMNPTSKLDVAGSSGWPLAVSPDNVQ